MTFTEGGSFEGGRVGRRGRGGAVAGGGVGLAIVAFLIYQFTGVNVGPALDNLQGGAVSGGGQVDTVKDCSAEEANAQRDCRLSATLQALDTYWATTLPTAGIQATQPDAWTFEAATSTGCGNASSSTGPFYCPSDQSIYLDLGFFDLLRSQFGASDGPLAQMYVVAHEYGHHIQSLTGVMTSINRQETGETSDSVRLELQADCYAGMWAGAAATTVDPDTGVTFLEPITSGQLADALSAAQAVGDDHIQGQSGGGINPDTWTHGSSEQRQRWFTTGYEQGTLEACDTFATDRP